MTRRLTLSGDALTKMMNVAHQLGGGRDLDDILHIVARTVIEVIGFDAVAVNVRRDDGDLEVRAVIGPPEVEELRGGRMSEVQWREMLGSCERWGGLFFSRALELPPDVPSADPWRERLSGRDNHRVSSSKADSSEPWQAEFALLAPIWSEGRTGGTLQGVISLDLPRSGRTPDAEQRMLLHLFAIQVGIALDRVSEANHASDRVSLYRSAFAESPLATVLLDAQFRLTDVNDAFLQLADAVPGELDQRHLDDLLDIGLAEWAARLGRLEPGKAVSVSSELRLHHPRGMPWDRWVEVTVRRVDSMNDEPRYVCTLTDRTEARNEIMAIRHRADHDALTGLSARPVWLSDLEHRLTRRNATRPDVVEIVGVLFCDLDSFKRVNDISGHHAGDETLVTIAGLLMQVTEPADSVCRWGGDEFAIVTTRDSVAALTDLAAAITSAIDDMAASADPADPVAGVSISIGIAATHDTTRVESATTFTELADRALYRAKSDPHNRVQVTEI